MSGLKEIRRRIQSVVNTKQITRAMKLVSAAKLRRAQDAAVNGRAYRDRLGQVLGKLVADLPDDYSHPLLEHRDTIGKRRIIAVSGERGLCGAYNTNIVKAVQAEMQTDGAEVAVVPIGRRTVSSANRYEWNIVSAYEGLSENAAEWPSAEIADSVIKDYINGECDEVVLFYTTFVSAMTQKVTREVLLPFNPASVVVEQDVDGAEVAATGKTKFDPSAKEIFSQLIPLVVKTQIVQAGLESKASEHAARMTAMDSATNNANDLIDSLRLFYNRARQSSITKELLDIVGGAEALK